MTAAGHRRPGRKTGQDLFWNPLTRVLIVVLLLIALVLLAVGSLEPSECEVTSLFRAAC